MTGQLNQNVTRELILSLQFSALTESTKDSSQRNERRIDSSLAATPPEAKKSRT
jgi:hypothetical protein